MLNQWDERYNRSEYSYGTEPNLFLKDFIEKNKPGKLLLPGDGEGRNSVFAAKSGWEVIAFDSSRVARIKALKLAREMNVTIHYDESSVTDFSTNHQFDLISLIFLHLQPETRKLFHKKLVDYLKPQGRILLEVFSKEQINYPTGGPKNPDMLYSINELKDDFKGLTIDLLEKSTTVLSEGTHHNGQAETIRMLATKK